LLRIVVVAFHKPWGVLSAFRTDGSGHETLAAFGLPPRIYPVGRLDADSEGLLLLSDEPWVTARLHAPQAGHTREYWVQVEREPEERALEQLRSGVELRGVRTRKCRVRRLAIRVPERVPPVRFRLRVPTAWIAMELTEGRNRQVRRMTAAVGHPTLRLVRVRVGCLALGRLPPGCFEVLDATAVARLFEVPDRVGGVDAWDAVRPWRAR